MNGLDRYMGYKFEVTVSFKPTSSQSESELEEEASPLDTSMGGSSMVFRGDGYSEAENKVCYF